ncbi:hypothetical protein Tco_1183984 [Tanacetum coccineum]
MDGRRSTRHSSDFFPSEIDFCGVDVSSDTAYLMDLDSGVLDYLAFLWQHGYVVSSLMDMVSIGCQNH